MALLWQRQNKSPIELSMENAPMFSKTGNQNCTDDGLIFTDLDGGHNTGWRPLCWIISSMALDVPLLMPVVQTKQLGLYPQFQTDWLYLVPIGLSKIPPWASALLCQMTTISLL